MKELLKISLIMMLALMATSAFAQTDDGDDDGYEDVEPFEDSWKERIVWGGNIFPGYSNGWILDASPLVGYKLTNSTIAGVGVNFFYRSFRSPFDPNRNQSIIRSYGGRAFVMQDLLFGLFAQAEFDYNFRNERVEDAFDNILFSEDRQAPGLLLGGGYSQRGGRIGYNLTFLYDVLYSSNNSTRISPVVFRGGIILGI